MIIQPITGQSTATNQPSTGRIIQPLTSKPTNNPIQQVQAPAKGFSIGDTIGNAITGVENFFNPPKIPIMTLSSGVKLRPMPSTQPDLSTNQASSAMMTVTPKSVNQQAKSLQQTQQIKSSVTQLFPGGSKLFSELMIDPLTLRNNPIQTIKDALPNLVKDIQTAVTDTKNKAKLRDTVFATNQPFSAKIGSEAKVISAVGNLAFSPITSLFTTANKIPVIGTVSKLLTLAFSVAGEGATDISNTLIDRLPLSKQDKANLKPGIGEIVALATQLLAGKALEISAEKRGELINKYGVQDAMTIETKAKELAQAKKTILQEGENTPQQVIDHVMNTDIANTSDGQKMLKTATEAQKAGQNIYIEPQEITAFEKNIKDYQQSPGVTVGVKPSEDAALRDITAQVNNPTIVEHTQNQIKEAITNRELLLNKDGTITLYRAGSPTTSERLVSATYDRMSAEKFVDDAKQQGKDIPITEFQVKPADIKAFIGKGEKEVLVESTIAQPKGEVKNSLQIEEEFKTALENANDAHEGSVLTNQFTDNAIISGQNLKATRAMLAKQLKSYTDTGNYKRDYAMTQDLKNDTTEGEYITALENNIYKIDLALAKDIKTPGDATVNPIIDEISAILKENESNQSNQKSQRLTSSGSKNAEVENTNRQTTQNSQSANSPSTNESKSTQSTQRLGRESSPTETAKPLGEGNTRNEPNIPERASSNATGIWESVSTLGLRVEQTAIEKKLVNELSNLPEYSKMDMKEQAKLSANLLSTDPQKALRIALGEEVPPQGLLAQSVFKALENSITTSELANQLAHSPLVGEATSLGQQIKALDVKTSDSPVEAIKQVIDARQKAIETKLGKTIKQATTDTIKDIDTEIKKVSSKAKLVDFIKELQCK